jgi:hypothetical protein
VIGKRNVTVFAREVHVAALRLNSDDIVRRIVVDAAGLGVEFDSAHIRHRHLGSGFGLNRNIPQLPTAKGLPAPPFVFDDVVDLANMLWLKFRRREACTQQHWQVPAE